MTPIYYILDHLPMFLAGVGVGLVIGLVLWREGERV